MRARCTKTAAYTWHAEAIWTLLLFWPTVARSGRLDADLDERSYIGVASILSRVRIPIEMARENSSLFNKTIEYIPEDTSYQASVLDLLNASGSFKLLKVKQKLYLLWALSLRVHSVLIMQMWNVCLLSKSLVPLCCPFRFFKQHSTKKTRKTFEF